MGDEAAEGSARTKRGSETRDPEPPDVAGPTDFEKGVLIGLLVGEGHFGGDGRQPHIVLRMHTDHEPLFRWILRTFPGGRLYGPYDHSGRRYYQWMARGTYLRDTIVPILDACLSGDIDAKAAARYQHMKLQYRNRLAPPEG